MSIDHKDAIDFKTETSSRGNWAMVARNGPSFTITANGEQVEVSELAAPGEPSSRIEASTINLLALMLGRKPLDEVNGLFGFQRGVEKISVVRVGSSTYWCST